MARDCFAEVPQFSRTHNPALAGYNAVTFASPASFVAQYIREGVAEQHNDAAGSKAGFSTMSDKSQRLIADISGHYRALRSPWFTARPARFALP